MKKKLLSAVLSVAMIATVLAGCGGSGASTSQTGAAGESTAAAAAEEGSSAASAATSTDGVKITVLNTDVYKRQGYLSFPAEVFPEGDCAWGC